MVLIRFLWARSRKLLVAALIGSILSGLANSALIAVINRALNPSRSISNELIWAFVGLCVFAPVSRFFAQNIVTRLAQSARVSLLARLTRKVANAPLRQLEEIGTSRILSALTDDVDGMTSGLLTIPNVCLSGAMLLGCAVYLSWVSWIAFCGVGLFILLGLSIYFLLSTKADRFFLKASKNRDILFGHFRGLTEGMKELKLHRKRRIAFLDNSLAQTAEAVREDSVTAYSILTVIWTSALFLYFVLVGLLLLAVPRIAPIKTELVVSYTLTLLFMLIPIDSILGLLSEVNRGRLAFERVEELGFLLSAEPATVGPPAEEGNSPWNTLELVNVVHTYKDVEEGREFTLGPIQLRFQRGELIFIMGGNGSGKTTLGKLLAGLYSPESGMIRTDGKPVTEEAMEDYRQHFSAVFSDFYLFECLLGLESSGLDERAAGYLKEFQLDHKVTIKNGIFSTRKLSLGQQKRLALLTTYLENRPVLLFDEWAADQDPAFKQVFYLHLLPQLKSKGKLVFVITHDDRYAYVADRIIKLDQGQIMSDTRPTESESISAGRGR